MRKNNGITLISLVITIIIMLILVGVSITLAVNGGLFEYAGNAVGDTENAIKNEQGLIDDIIENYINTNVPIEGNDGEMFSPIYTENTTIKQGEYTATIPAGFAVGTSEGINKIENGLVIRDKDGNEFVWVPCTTDKANTSVTQYAKDTKYNDGTSGWKQSGYVNDAGKKYTDWEDNINKNEDSVTRYKGFYVGRYEAGIPENATFYPDTEKLTYTYYKDENEEESIRDTDKYVPVSKKNNPSWNGISQKNAVTVSANMYNKDEDAVTSSLIDSYAWDTIVNWMESKVTGIAMDSTEYGNYVSSSLNLTNQLYATYTINFNAESEWEWTMPTVYERNDLEVNARNQDGIKDVYEVTTGSMESTKVLNIYDMAGNMWEWTTETGYHDVEESTEGTLIYAVRRGGGFSITGKKGTVSYRSCMYDVSYTFYDVGFECVKNFV